MQTLLERLTPGSSEWTRHGLQHLQRYRFASLHARGKHVLDLACGVGYGSYALRKTAAASVVGIDRDESAIAYARSHYSAPLLCYAAGDAHSCDFESAPFDVITSFETIEHLPDPRSFLDNVARLLIPNGVLVISAPNTLQYKKGRPPLENPYHLNEPDYATLKAWLELRFAIEEEWEQSPIYQNAVSPTPDLLSMELLRLGALRLLRRTENSLRRLCRKTLPPLPAFNLPNGAMEVTTDIFPLLPERRELANVFLFVCRKC